MKATKFSKQLRYSVTFICPANDPVTCSPILYYMQKYLRGTRVEAKGKPQ